MDIKPIHTDNDYQEALKLASSLFDNQPTPNTPEGNTFDILLTLIESYEAKSFPISSPDLIEAIKFRLE
jgi:HTH-type transcriptional regulator/antitoxin HigA